MNFFEKFVMRHADFLEAVERSPLWDTFIVVVGFIVSLSILVAAAST